METMREKLINEMKGVFGDDHRRIDHALDVLAHAEAILATEPDADATVVTAAAILHDIGIHAAEAKHGSSAARWQELEGPPIARAILDRLGVPAATAEHVVRIVANHHSARDIDTLEFRIVWDADWLVNLPEEQPNMAGAELGLAIERIFKTTGGRQRAAELFVTDERKMT